MRLSLRLSIAIFLILIGAGGFTYYKLVIQPGQSNGTATTQTAVVRRGNLVISASGSGTLVASDEKDLSFSASGEVTNVYVKPGDQVNAGTLLAAMDSSQAQNDYTQAQQKYVSLTSSAAIVSAQDAVAKAQANLNSAKLQLEYLISPGVMYWEDEVNKGNQELKQAKASVKASPSNADAQQALTKAKAFLGFAQDKLKDAWDKYYKDYVPATFPVAVDADKDIYYTPTKLEISTARAAITDAQTKLKESQELYNVLTGSPMPKNPDTGALISLRQAKFDFENAQAKLKGTKIIAPISGTILTVNISAGNTVDKSIAITMANLNNLSVETYLDESDYSVFQVGNEADVVFDALPNQTFTGKVASVDPFLTSAGGVSVVSGMVTLDSTNANLVVGMSASVDVIAEQARNAVLVPVKALHQDSSGQYRVFVMENGNPVQRNVEIGLQDLVNAEVKSGLNPGDVVLLGTTGTD